MAWPYPVNAYWSGAAPDVQALAAGIAGHVRLLGARTHADDGLLIELPAGMALFLDQRIGSRVEFRLTGRDLLLPFGAAEEARVVRVVSHVLGALVRDLGAVACFAGSALLEHMVELVDGFDAAMASWNARAPLPLDRLGAGAWMLRWRASLPAAIEPQRVTHQVACHDYGAAPIF